MSLVEVVKVLSMGFKQHDEPGGCAISAAISGPRIGCSSRPPDRRGATSTAGVQEGARFYFYSSAVTSASIEPGATTPSKPSPATTPITSHTTTEPPTLGQSYRF
jgi:hypothetical protein